MTITSARYLWHSNFECCPHCLVLRGTAFSVPIYRRGRPEMLRPVFIHVRHSTNQSPILRCRILSVLEFLWSPFFVVCVALQGVYKSGKPQTTCESLTACCRQTTGVMCCRNLLSSWHCTLISSAVDCKVMAVRKCCVRRFEFYTDS